MNNDEKYIEEFVKDIPFEDARAEHRDALRSQLLSAFPRHRLRPRTLQVPMWRTIMRTPITKLAAAAAIVAVLWLGIHMTGRSSVAWADVVRNIQNARTLVYQTTFTTDGRSQAIDVMIRDPGQMRVEMPDGKTTIMDLREGRALVLDSRRMSAMLTPIPQQTFSTYDAFRNFRDNPDYSVRRLGHRTVDGVMLEGFELTKTGDQYPVTVYADPKTSLPVRVEQIVEASNGQFIETVTTDIAFDVDLDDSLFSLEVPAGYTDQLAGGPADRISRLRERMETGIKMNEIMRACDAYMQEHDGQWPEQLQDLASYGAEVDATKYVYVKPGPGASPQRVVLYERYDSWGDGVNVGCVDGHVQFIADEASFKDRLE